MNKEAVDSLRRMVYASMTSEEITRIVAPRLNFSREDIGAQVKVMHDDYLKWGISCSYGNTCNKRQCEKDSSTGKIVRCSFPT